MSHPASDPSLTAVAARMAGLRTPHPASARILEIGCASGHNLLPLAMRWPESRFTGFDLSGSAIRTATTRAEEAGITNVSFLTADLANFEPSGGPFDYIIAHGVFSWVPDDAKSALLDFCHRHLSPGGIATISFNVASGWESRMPVIEKIRNLAAKENIGISDALPLARREETSAETIAIMDDMLAKGPEILPFDDFAPVNDPRSLADVAGAATTAKLRWLGESDPAENFPRSLGEEDRRTLMTSGEDPLAIHDALDQLTGRTFRSPLFCRDDAPVSPRVSTAVALEFSVGETPSTRPDTEILRVIRDAAPSCIPVAEIAARLPSLDAPALAREVFQGVSNGTMFARMEPILIPSVPPDRPALDPFRLLCARENLPLVDARHRPCTFQEDHYRLLEKMDGSLTLSQLAAISHAECPRWDFPAWLAHLTERGLFS